MLLVASGCFWLLQVRFLLEFCLIPFDERPVRDQPTFGALKASGVLAFGQVPLLEMDGLALVQTQAILRYVAGKKGLRGATAADEARADMAVNGIFDARMPLITARFGADPHAALAKFGAATLPKLCAHLESLLQTHSGPYLCEGGLTYADVALLELLCYAADELEGGVEGPLRGCPRVLAHFEHMSGFEHVRSYLSAERRKPPPDAAFVRRTCAILGMAVPAHAQEHARSPVESPVAQAAARVPWTTIGLALAGAVAVAVARRT